VIGAVSQGGVRNLFQFFLISSQGGGDWSEVADACTGTALPGLTGRARRSTQKQRNKTYETQHLDFSPGRSGGRFGERKLNPTGFADEGETPFLCLPFEVTYKRLTILDSCTPPAP
jgi:hypothetical protein